MMHAIPTMILIGVLLPLAGCGARKNHVDVLQNIGRNSPIDAPGLSFQQQGSHFSGGANSRFSRRELIGEIVSTNETPLPTGLIDQIAERLQAELKAQGCETSENRHTRGIIYDNDSSLEKSNVEMTSIQYSFHGSTGQVEVILVDRAYNKDTKTRVVAQLLFIGNEIK